MTDSKTVTEWSTTVDGADDRDAKRAAKVFGLVVVESPDGEARGRRVAIKTRLSIGRSSDQKANLIVRDSRISGLHAVIRRHKDSVFHVHDLDSRNGTRVNGSRVSQAALSVGDVIRLGRTLVVFDELVYEQPEDDTLIGRSAAFVNVMAHVRNLAPSRLPILVLGETGTGKEVVARRIHELSARRGHFVAVNCSAIPRELAESYLFGHKRGAFTGANADSPGVFRSARDGTLFLDEIGELPEAQQPKLLRVLECQEFTPVGSTRVAKSNARIVAATNADLKADAMAGRFRRDLFARLAGAIVDLPPLRARRTDIPLLARHFLTDGAQKRAVEWDTGFLERMLLHDWPLNVRELRFLMERLSVLAGDAETLTRAHLDAVGFPIASVDHERAEEKPAGVGPKLARGERPTKDELVVELTRLQGHVTKLADHYRKHPKQIYRWLEAYELDPKDYRAG